jgi:hypothetical protein
MTGMDFGFVVRMSYVKLSSGGFIPNPKQFNVGTAE